MFKCFTSGLMDDDHNIYVINGEMVCKTCNTKESEGIRYGE